MAKVDTRRRGERSQAVISAVGVMEKGGGGTQS